MARTSPQPNRRPSIGGNYDLLKRALVTEGNPVRFRQGKIIAYSSASNTVDVQIGGATDSAGNAVVTEGIKLFGNFDPDVGEAVWLVTDGIDIFAMGQLAPYGGAVGATGAAGKTVLNGTGAPSLAIGAVGDFYIDTATYEIYGPRATLSWGSPTNLIGATGATGSTGATGATGATGTAATIAVGTVTTGSAGSSAVVTNAGTSSAAVFDFTIPKGDTGLTGSTGAAATISVGTVTTGSVGSSVTVTNSGTSGAAVFDFSIPVGATGATGPAGAAGDRYQTTSTSTLTIATSGTLNLTVGTGLSYSTNQTILVSYDVSNHMHAEITTYNSGTGAIVAEITDADGSGTYSSWIVNLSGAVGAVGPAGTTGATGATGSAGPTGATGATGAGAYYQATAPTSPLTGYLWVDSSQTLSTYTNVYTQAQVDALLTTLENSIASNSDQLILANRIFS